VRAQASILVTAVKVLLAALRSTLTAGTEGWVFGARGKIGAEISAIRSAANAADSSSCGYAFAAKAAERRIDSSCDAELCRQQSKFFGK